MPPTQAITYRNPVYPDYFADPFVLKLDDHWWAYGTGPARSNGWQFPVLRSHDLAHWEYIAHALAPATPFAHWAPEVAHRDGAFYLFYSASDVDSDEGHRLRVATSQDPAGPFCDSGRLLLPDAGFSVDPHPFRDPASGKWFLYFAMDFIEDEPSGTGLAVVELHENLMSVAGQPRIVMRTTCPWQIYQRDRNYKGRIWKAWHCLEGPFVIFHDGRYYCLYSAGAWYSEHYGVGFAVADHPLGPWRDDSACQGPVVLRTTPNVLGPGHASVTCGPDDRTLVLAYHAWDRERSKRRFCIDPIRWTPRGPRCDGPSTEPRTLPS